MEIEKYGNIDAVINEAFKKIASPLRISISQEELKMPLTYARVEHKNKFAQIYLASNKETYLPNFWRDGVCLAHGQTNDIYELVKAIDFWLYNNISTNEFSRNFPLITPSKKASAFDENREVEYAWNSYLNDDSFKDLWDFMELAVRDKVIGKLFPFTSLMRLCFSRCTGIPYTGDTPIVIPIPNKIGKFEVRLTDDMIIGRGNASEALKMVKENLPVDIKPAVKGTANDL